MPRANRAKPITLLLPSPATPAPPPLFDSPTHNDNDSDQPSLEVLLLAREIAAEKGHVLDVDAFLPQKPYVPRAGPSTPPPYSAGEPSTPRPGYPFSPYGLASPGSGWKKRASSPALHWKTKKKLAMLAAREAEAAAAALNAPVLPATPAIDADVSEAGPSTPAVDTALADGAAPLPTPPPVSAGLKRKVDEVDRGEIQAGASYWNSLLIRARKDRGPQWDYNTQSYQVDRLSLRYYTHGLDPRSTPSPEPPQPSALPLPSPSPHVRLSDLPSHSSSPSKPAPPDLGMQRKQSAPGYGGGLLSETPTRRESLPPHAQQSPSPHISQHAFSPALPPSQHQQHHHQLQQPQQQANTYRQPSQSPLPTPTSNGSANQMNMAGINPAMLQLQTQLARQNQASPQGQSANSLPQGKGLNAQQMVAMGMITPQQAAQLGQFGQQGGFAAMGGLPGMAGMGGMGGMQGMAGLPNMGGMGAMAGMAGMNPNMMLSPHSQNQGQMQLQGRSPMMAQPQGWEINS